MNYLSHFVYNHDVCDLPAEPHFALGVVLPDLWLRFSRRRRIRWKAVRAAETPDPVDGALRAGLLNHVATDRRFHALPVFAQWQRDVRNAVDTDGVHAALVDFLAHMSIELALDHHLVVADDGIVQRFYDTLAPCDPQDVALRVGRLGQVDTGGLDDVIAKFMARRFLRHYRTAAGLSDVVRIVLSLADIPPPPDHTIDEILAHSLAVASPTDVWREMQG